MTTPTRSKTVIKSQQVLEEVTDWTKIDTQVVHEGRQIKLPADPTHMDYDTALETIERIRDQEAQEFDVSELVKGAPWDCLTAMYLAMQEIYGVVMSNSIQSWFGEIKPDFMTVHTGPRDQDRIQVPMGQMTLPGVKAPVYVQMTREGARISGTVKRADRARLVEIANLARRKITEQSVYKGKAIRLLVDNDGDLVLNQQPEFLDLSAVKETDMIHTRDTELLIQTNLLAPLKHAESCRKAKIPLKRGILLEGKYGCGKSLTARVAAKVATDNGWTFILLNRSQGLKEGIELARNYQPAILFAEDIDRSADRSDESVNDLVNLLDGVITKNMEIMVCLTTNHIEQIDKALLRPGRFDAVISIDTPDAETAERIIRSYAVGLLAEDAELVEVGTVTAGMIPASIREVVERAKLGMLCEGRDHITANDLLASAIGMQRHMALLNPVENQKTNAEIFQDALVGMIADKLSEEMSDMGYATSNVDGTLTGLRSLMEVMLTRTDKSLRVASAGASSAAEANAKADKILANI